MYRTDGKFESTNHQLQQRLWDVDDHIMGEKAPVSDREANYFMGMVYDFVDWLNDHRLLDENNEIDQKRLKEIGEDMIMGRVTDDEDF